MTQGKQSINSHIEDYLDYYCGLSHAPGFAILLKGKWGCGKTWFIDKYREKLEKLEDKKHKCLYVSLYGMTSFSEIEDTFFQQLHPVLSSKGMAITGKILKGLLKGTLKIDLDGDTKDDASVTIQIPEIDLPEYLKNTDKSILIFDDLERCQIDIGNILGYINYFVEHQELKVILVANEDKLLENNSYKDIKEKLIGKTFDVSFDLDGALKDFIRESQIPKLKTFLSKNSDLIKELYQTAEYENLRSLKQIILDFERIFQELPEQAKSKPELLKDFLSLLTAFSIEIKRGSLSPKNIIKLQEAQVFKLTEARRNCLKTRAKSDQDDLSNPSYEDNNKVLMSLKEIIDRYTFLNLPMYEPLPNLAWWQTFLDKGDTNPHELRESILNSKYFQDENTPNWVRLWHFLHLSDSDFEELLTKVELEYTERKLIDIGEIKHVTGLFLHLSDSGLYASKDKKELLKDSKLYIDYLIANNKLDLNLGSDTTPHLIEDMSGYKSLGYQGTELKEFQDFCSYIKTARQSAIEKSLPRLGLELLEIMKSDSWEFYRMICLNDTRNTIDESYQVYFEIPIFKYIEANDFMEKVLSISFNNQNTCFYGFKKRYEFKNINKKIFNELEWLKDIQKFLLEEANRRKGKPSGYRLEFLNKKYLNKAIEKLETSKSDYLKDASIQSQ